MKPNDVIMVKDLELGSWICSYIEKNEIKLDLTLSNPMLDMCVKQGSLKDEKILFNKIEEKYIISCTTMIDGHAKLGEYDAARCVLDAMPKQEIATWIALISANEQNGKPKDAFFAAQQECEP